MNVLIILSTLVIGLVFGYGVNQQANTSAASEVYAVCNSARLEVSGESEEACGAIQDKYNAEFLCEARNSSVDNHCWVEVK